MITQSPENNICGALISFTNFLIIDLKKEWIIMMEKIMCGTDISIDSWNVIILCSTSTWTCTIPLLQWSAVGSHPPNPDVEKICRTCTCTTPFTFFAPQRSKFDHRVVSPADRDSGGGALILRPPAHCSFCGCFRAFNTLMEQAAPPSLLGEGA